MDGDEKTLTIQVQQTNCKARTRAKVEHPVRGIKRHFGFVKVRFCGLMKNTAQLTTLFAVSNLRMAGKQLMGMGELRA
ncbi:hypothetical protein O999_13120 [Pseudomonas putida LF54]|nr:hypothetical protein O999_13120 [Pseudomonas putida LF54]